MYLNSWKSLKKLSLERLKKYNWEPVCYHISLIHMQFNFNLLQEAQKWDLRKKTPSLSSSASAVGYEANYQAFPEFPPSKSIIWAGYTMRHPGPFQLWNSGSSNCNHSELKTGAGNKICFIQFF